MPLNGRARTGLGVLVFAWVILAIVAGCRGSWDVVTAMLVSYCLGGVMADVEFDSGDHPPDGSV